MDSLKMPNLPNGVSAQEIRSLLQSDTGRQLIKILNQKDGAALRQAAEAAKNGKYKKAYETLAPLLEGTNASELIKGIGNQNG